ncbi:aconitate hydratase 3, partial [Striga asiatica]
MVRKQFPTGRQCNKRVISTKRVEMPFARMPLTDITNVSSNASTVRHHVQSSDTAHIKTNPNIVIDLSDDDSEGILVADNRNQTSSNQTIVRHRNNRTTNAEYLNFGDASYK